MRVSRFSIVAVRRGFVSCSYVKRMRAVRVGSDAPRTRHRRILCVSAMRASVHFLMIVHSLRTPACIVRM